MKTKRSRSNNPSNAQSSRPPSVAPAPVANSPHIDGPLRKLFRIIRGREFFRGASRSHDPSDNRASVVRDSAILDIPDHSKTADSEKAFIVVQNQVNTGSPSGQDIMVQITPPPEPVESSVKLTLSILEDTGKNTDSSLQSIDYFDATDLQPFTSFSKIMEQLPNVHPRAKAALNGLLWASQTIIKQESRDKSIHRLLRKMREAYEFLAKEGELVKALLMLDVLASLSEQVVECAKFVARLSFLARVWDRLEKDVLLETDAITQRYTDSLDSLVAVLRGSTSQITVINVYHVLQGLGYDLRFNAIPRATGIAQNPTKTCLEGTRSEILGEIIDWAYAEGDAQCVYWLTGDEGTGKSAIIHTVARWLKESGRLGSFFCFDVTQQSNRCPERLFTTIARDLADFDPGLREFVADAMRTDQSLAAEILLQWRRLVLEPLKKSSHHLGPVFLVIDALDECRPDSSRENILRILADEVTQLPPNVHVLVASRAISDIHLALQNKPHVRTMSLDDIPREHVERDIQLYISHRLHALILDEQYALLTTKADGLFEWARIACDSISTLDQLGGGSSSDNLLERILSPSDAGLRSPLDQIYTLVLKWAIQDSHQARYEFGSVMQQVLGLLEPLPTSSLNEMRRFFSAPRDHFNVDPILKSISPLVTGVMDPTSPVRLVHGSFYDFLTDHARSGDFFVDMNGIQQELARSSLASMKRDLHFNICELEDSSLRNSDVPDLAKRVRERISPHLSYSCRFWIAHAQHATFETQLENELRSFFKNEYLLFWLEVLGLLGHIHEAYSMLTVARRLISGRDQYSDISTIIRDSQKFIEMFGNAITQSTPHLYVSALPFIPEQSILAGVFASKALHVPRIITGRDVVWPSSQLSLIGHADWVRSVAISRDGRRTVSSSDDSTIRMWDTETGLEIGDPLEHSGFVVSVAFSPDSKTIVSGSSDTTIRAWDAQTGLQVGDPLQGHSGSVNSVAFCPDGSWFASGSSDTTIRIWDTNSHAQVAILEGHPKPINSIAISFNGERIVSGSNDGTIRVWSTLTWAQVGDAIDGHTSPINSIAFSPDGKLVASGSDDSTICLWNFKTGSLTGSLEGHIDCVTSVAFSADTKYIISGSVDRTVRVWDTVTHTQVGNSLQEHTGKVSSVAISHDGRVIVSASWDGSVRTWDTKLSPKAGRQTSPVFSVALSPATKRIVSGSFDAALKVYDRVTGAQVDSKPLKGHSSEVVSIAISLDETRIASGSSDKTVRIWDMETKTEVGSPLRGHTSRVNTVALSPNGNWVVSGSDDNTIRVWDIATSQTVTILEEHKDAVNSIVFSLDGRCFVSGSADKTIRVWDAVTWSTIGTPLKGHSQPIRSVALSPDGAQIVSGSSDNTARLWEVSTGSLLHTLGGHTGTVRSVVFSLDGRYIVSGSDDSTVRVWDAKIGSQLNNSLFGHTSPVRSVTLDADWIVSGSEDGTIRVWDLGAVLRGGDRAASTSLTNGGPIRSDKGKERADGNMVQRHHVRFSPFSHHALHNAPRVDGITYKTDPIRVREDGWIEAVGARRHLILWVPTHLRNTLWHYPPANVMVIPRGIELDLSEMVYGSGWEECWAE